VKRLAACAGAAASSATSAASMIERFRFMERAGRTVP
jgi:hypothetical protein